MIRHLVAAGLLCVLAAAALAPAHAEVPPPLKQLAAGVPPGDIRCNGDMVLMQNGGRPACVMPHTADRLLQRGWGHMPPASGDTNDDARQMQVVVDAGDIESPVIPPETAAANNEFAVDMYRQLSGGEGNVFFSPTSMYTAFSMLYEGTRGNTASQLRDAFGFEPGDAARHEAAAHLMASLSRDDGHSVLEMANSLWIAERFDIYDSYVDVVRNTYLADTERVDFEDTSDRGAVKMINGWVDERTRGKIPKVLSQDDMDADTMAAILNAIYFKGTWVTQFPPEDTSKSKFWKNATDGTDADFMHVLGTFGYGVHDGVQVLRMPYHGDRLSMLAVLPPERGGIGQLEERLSADLLREWRDVLQETDVTVSFPKFKAKTNYDLIGYLKSLGMSDVFDETAADLSGIANVDRQNLYVKKALHDAYVQVNEEGTEAAAVTTIVIFAEDEAPEPPRFTADHPFLFVIQDDESGTVLFMGRVSDP